jgi:hypothetical protein
MNLKNLIDDIAKTCEYLNSYREQLKDLTDSDNAVLNVAIQFSEYSKCLLECMPLDIDTANQREIQEGINSIFSYEKDKNYFNNLIAQENEFDIGIPTAVSEDISKDTIEQAIDLTNKTFKENTEAEFILIDKVA